MWGGPGLPSELLARNVLDDLRHVLDELQLVVERDPVLANCGKRGLDRPADLVQCPDPQRREPPAPLLVERQRGEVVVRRDEPRAIDAGGPKCRLRLAE